MAPAKSAKLLRTRFAWKLRAVPRMSAKNRSTGLLELGCLNPQLCRTDSRAALRLVDRRGRRATACSWIVETWIDGPGVVEHPWLGRVRHAWTVIHTCPTWAQALVCHRRSIGGVGHWRSTRGHRQSTLGTAPGEEGVVEVAAGGQVAAVRVVDGPN